MRSNASVSYDVPLLNDSKTMTEIGVYSTPISERLIIAPESPSIDVKNLKTNPKEVSVSINGVEKYSSSISGIGNAPIAVLDYIETYEFPPNISVVDTISEVQISNLETITYEIPVEIIVKQEVLSNGVPLANATLTYSLPNHDYSETVTTNADGIADVHINEKILITISGGEIIELAEPIVLPTESQVIVANWWGDGDDNM